MKERPRHLNLLKIRLPLPGVVSILHRASGVLLILSLPVALAALDCSLADEAGYRATADFFSHPLAKLFVWAAAWALFHHLCAGFRFLLLDLHFGVDLPTARVTAAAALAGGILLALVFGIWLWS